MKKRYIFLLLVSVLLLLSTIYGEFFPNDYRSKFSEPIKSYNRTIAVIDSLYDEHKEDELFFKESVKAYYDGITYQWPKEYCKIPFSENYILNSLSYFDPILKKMGFTAEDNLFSVYQSTDYETALGRGFGICSQNALGYSDLLYQRYGLSSYVVGLSGHVLVTAKLANGDTVLLDPSLSLYIPRSLDYMENHPEYAIQLYKKTRYPELAGTYDETGNTISTEVGSFGYNPKLYYMERTSNIAKYAIPILLVLWVIGRIYLKEKRY